MEMDEGLRLFILMTISFVYGFAMRHCITMPVNNNKWRGEVPKSRKAPPKPLYHPNK